MNNRVLRAKTRQNSRGALTSGSAFALLTSCIAANCRREVADHDEGYFLRAQLVVSLPGVERHLGEALIEEAHKTCPYSKATRGNIDVEILLA